MVFRNIEELIRHFRATSDVCPRTRSGFPVTEIDHSSLILLERLCSSDMDDMWYGTWENGDKKVPIHIRRLSPQLHSKLDVLQETNIMQKLLHDNVVQLYGISTAKVPMYVITECLENGSLLYYLREGDGKCINFRKRIYLAAQVACGIDYLNSQLCVHRYICDRNMFLSKVLLVVYTNGDKKTTKTAKTTSSTPTTPSHIPKPLRRSISPSSTAHTATGMGPKSSGIPTPSRSKITKNNPRPK